MGADTLIGEVDIIEPMGAETLLHLIIGQRDLHVVVDCRTRLAAGTRVHLRCRPGVTRRSLVKIALVIVVILAVVIALGFGAAQLYVWYLGTLR